MEANLELVLQLAAELKDIKADLQKREKSQIELLKDNWIDGQDLSLALHISKRALQSLRTSKRMPYTIFNSKCWYKVSDLEAMLESNYSRNHQNKKP